MSLSVNCNFILLASCFPATAPSPTRSLSSLTWLRVGKIMPARLRFDETDESISQLSELEEIISEWLVVDEMISQRLGIDETFLPGPKFRVS